MLFQYRLQLLRVWSVPTILALILFTAVRPALAQAVLGGGPLEEYVLAHDLEVGEDTVDGYRQVYYMWEGERVFVTQGPINSNHPATKGPYMVWMRVENGAPQIVLYNIQTKVTLQLTNTSTNQNPQVNSRGEVVWERWIGERWQIFYFDGVSVQQLTDGDVSFDPVINDDTIAFNRQTSGEDHQWSAYAYNIRTKQAEMVGEGLDVKGLKLTEKGVLFPIRLEREESERQARAAEEEVRRLADEIAARAGEEMGSVIGKKNISGDEIESEEQVENYAAPQEVEVPASESPTPAPSSAEVPLSPPEVEAPPIAPPVVSEEDITRELLENEPPVTDNPPVPPVPASPAGGSEPSPAPEPVVPEQTLPASSADEPAPAEPDPVSETPPPIAPVQEPPVPTTESTPEPVAEPVSEPAPPSEPVSNPEPASVPVVEAAPSASPDTPVLAPAPEAAPPAPDAGA